MNRQITLLTTFLLAFFSIHQINAQCVTASAGGNAALTSNGPGSYTIACDAGPVTISSTTFDPSVIPASAIQWTSGQTGNFSFTPSCSNLGCTQFTPCVPSGTNIPQQCATFSSFGVPLTGNVPAGGTQTINFNISGFCYVPGATYSGDLGINLSGSGDVSLSVVQPDGVVQGPLTFAISLINGLSPIPLSLLSLDVDPNGSWSIIIEDAGAGSFGYTIDPNSQICIDAITTQGVQCADPIEVCVVGGCPSFVSAQPSQTSICSGESFTLGATLNPAGAPNVTYNWSGNGITAANQNSPNPSITVVNNSCNTVTETYTLNMTCTTNGSTIATNEQVNVTVHPAIDPSLAVIDNTTNILDPNCSITVTYPPCPGYTISGNTTFTSGDNGSIANFTISNGNAACDENVSSPITCIGTCTPASANVVTTACNAGGSFNVNVSITNLGSSTSVDVVGSDGNTFPGVTSTGGTYTFGPFTSGTAINIKLIDPLDPTCSTNLGLFSQNCFVCPNLTTINAIPTDVCDGTNINLVANVDQGVQGVDYSIQWYENGTAISGGNTANFTHCVSATDRCNASAYSYTAELTCLNNGTPSSTTLLGAGPLNVFPIPQPGVDFVFKNCDATPIDNCGNLSINIGGATNPAPGTSTVVTYTVSVPGAPASCQISGTTTVECPNCTDYPGDGTTTDKVVCWGESFDISNNSALVSSLGYEVGYVITPNPPQTYASTSALLAASLNGTNGPFAAPGSITASTYTNNGSLFTPTSACGDLLYFTPFLSFACQSYTAANESGTVETPPGSGFIAGVYQTPGIGGTTLSVPQVPFSSGLVNYNIELCVDDQTDDGAGAFGLCFAGEDNLQQNSLFGLITGLPGGGFSNFPNINNIHDSQQNECYNQNGWTANPSGELVSLVTVNLQDFCAGGNDSDFLGYDFQVDVNCNSVFPTICPDCDVLGAPVAVRMLPQVTLPNITPPANICDGDAINLLALNPAPSVVGKGKYSWFAGTPTAGGAIADPSNVVPSVGTTQYCVEYSYCQTGDCVVQKCVNITVDPLPSVGTPTFPQICPGDAYNLLTLNSTVTSGGGIINWYIGGTPANGGALIGSPNGIIPIGSELYCAELTDPNTGCKNTVCGSFTYQPTPVLLTAAPQICAGSNLQLNNYNTDLTTNAGTFTWYNADPATGATPLASTLFAPYNAATDGNIFYVEFTDAASGCSATTSVNVSSIALPVVNAPSFPPVCSGNSFDLTTLEASIATGGTFEWFLNDIPANGGILINNPTNIVPTMGTIYCAKFTDAVTGCSNSVCTAFNNIVANPTFLTTSLDVCDDVDLELTTFNNQLNGGPGNFTWYGSNPATGGMPLTSTLFVNYDAAVDGSVFYVTFMNSTTGCSATAAITFTEIDCCKDYEVFNSTYLPTDVIVQRANIMITESGTVPAGANIVNISDVIDHPPGFEVIIGSLYHAFNGDCSTPHVPLVDPDSEIDENDN